MTELERSVRRGILIGLCLFFSALAVFVIGTTSNHDRDSEHARNLAKNTTTIQRYVDLYLQKEKALPVPEPKIGLTQPIDVSKLQSVGFNASSLETTRYRYFYVFSSDRTYSDETIDFFYVTKDGMVSHKNDL